MISQIKIKSACFRSYLKEQNTRNVLVRHGVIPVLRVFGVVLPIMSQTILAGVYVTNFAQRRMVRNERYWTITHLRQRNFVVIFLLNNTKLVIDPSILINPCEDKKCGQSCIVHLVDGILGGICDSDGLCSGASDNLVCDNGTLPTAGKCKT